MADTQRIDLTSTWVEIADSVDYTIQNISAYPLRLKESAAQPTDKLGALLVKPDALINQVILQGKVWARADRDKSIASVSV